MRFPRTLPLHLLPFVLLTVAAPELPAQDIGTGPPVGTDFDLVPLRGATGEEAVYVAWRDVPSGVASGVLHLDDGVFEGFPTLPSDGPSNVSVGAGSAAGSVRAYAAWLDRQLRLVLAVFE
jgi:hypothetical protein